MPCPNVVANRKKGSQFRIAVLGLPEIPKLPRDTGIHRCNNRIFRLNCRSRVAYFLRGVENDPFFGIFAICNLDRSYTFIVPHYVLIPAPKAGPRKLVFRGPVGTLIQVRQAAESDGGFHPQIGATRGTIWKERRQRARYGGRISTYVMEIHTDVPLSTYTPTNYGQTR